jgi:hypothetical protein
MFTYGSQVNPSLGRQDFSSILQAAQAQAQATQQAAAIRAQTMANIGSTIGNAIQTYTQKQEQKKQKEAAVRTIGAIFENNPELAAGLKVPVDASGKPDRGAIEAVIKTFDSPADALKIASTLEELGVTRKARQQQEQAASYAALLRQGGGQVPSPVSNQALAQFSPQARVAGETAYLQNERQRAELLQTRAATQKAEAEAAALRAGKPKGNVYDSPQAGLAEIKRLTDAKQFPPGIVPVLKAEGNGYVIETIGAPAPPPGVESTYEQLGAKSAQASLDAYKQSFADAARAGQSGRLVVSALDKGATTGLFAPFKTIGLKILSEAAPGIKPELFEQELATKGIAALQAYGATGLAKGLGSMSNADREFFVALFPSITDTKQLNRFYALMAAENEKFANEDRKFVRELEEKGVRQDKILRELEARIEGRNVAQSIYEKVTGSGLSPKAQGYLD